MASESTEEGTVSVELTGGLDEWLDEQAASLDVTRETVVRQLLAAYRATDDFEDESLSATLDPSDLGVDEAVEDAVDAAVQDRLDAAVAAAVEEALDDRIDERVQSAVGDRLPDIADAVEGKLDARFESVESDFQGKIQDVRERVIQLKQATDAKAPADHDHDAFGQIDDLERELSALADDLEQATAALEDDLAAQSETLDDVESRLADAEDKLDRVAWVVNDLRDDQGGRDAHQRAVDRIKRAAAQEGLSTANCENCGEQVDISLLTDPQCPHCNTTVSDVRPEGGIFRTKGRLVTAAQLEAGTTDE